MGPTTNILLVFLTFFGTLCQQAPAYTKQFEVGTLYIYGYESTVLLNEPQPLPVSTSKDVGFKMEMTAQLTPVWQHPTITHEQILQLTVVSPKLSLKGRQGPSPPEGFLQRSSKLEKYKLHPIFLHWNNGQITKVYHVEGEELSLLNVMKGVSSLFQHQIKNVVQREVDTSGDCEVTYKFVDSTHVTKLKKDCKNVKSAPFFNQTNKVLGAVVDSQATTSYVLNGEDKTIKKATSMETHFLRVEARRQSGAEVMSKQVLQFRSREKVNTPRYDGKAVSEVLKAISAKLNKQIKSDQLATTPDAKDCIACKSLKELVSNFKNTLSAKNLGTQGSAIAFLRLLRKMRESEKEKILAVLKDKKNAKILPQLLDIAAAAQTEAAHRAVMAVVKFSGAIENPERYLISLSLATHPQQYLLRDMMKLLKKGHNNDHLYETMVLTAASLTESFAKVPSNAKLPIVGEVKEFILDGLQQCDGEACQLMFIRALKNLRMRDTMDVLLDFAEGEARKPAIYATRALQTMPGSFITKEVCKRLERIFLQLQREHDSSVRAMAADLLLVHDPSEGLVRAILDMLGSQTTKELNTLLLGRIQDLASIHPQHKQLLTRLLQEPRYNNYHVLGQGGLSSSFSRPLLQDSSANSSFTNMLEINAGLLKRSTVDVYVDSRDTQMRLLSFGIFAGGLSTFGGEDAVDDGEETNAGIEITLLDTQLRPYVFFSSQGELMSHMWAGTGSERTTALQGSLLLQDHLQVVPLQNGLNAELLLNGAISYDFAGQVQVSLWNRNAHSLVEVGAATIMQGVARVDSSFVQTLIEFNVGAQAQLNFISDLEFYDEVMMCMQMVQPTTEVVNNVRKLERIPGSNYVLRKYKKKRYPVPGKTYVMNRKNTELCNKMFKK